MTTNSQVREVMRYFRAVMLQAMDKRDRIQNGEWGDPTTPDNRVQIEHYNTLAGAASVGFFKVGSLIPQRAWPNP